MATTDMRPYAERLHATDPERFDCHFSGPVWSGGASWWVRDETRPAASVHEGKDSLEAWWAFWGPLADELKIRPHGVDKDGVPGTLSYEESRSWLEAIADAVCQEAERRAQDK